TAIAMQTLNNKRKEEVIVLQDESTKTKLSRQACTRKNKKLRCEQKQTEMLRNPNDDILPVIDDIIFNPSQRSVPLCPSDRISSKKIRTQHNISAKDLLIETLLREASTSNNSIDLPKIPPDFLSLVYSDIIKEKNDVKEPLDVDTNNKRLWIAFGRLLWKKLQHAYVELQNFFDTATIRKSRKEKTQLIVSARNNNKSLDKLVQLEHIFEPKCITDLGHRTLIHLEQLDDPDAVTTASNIVNWYYFHLLENPSHRSKEFWTNFIEHFGAYTRNNLLLFTSSNTASTHNINHHEYVSKLLRGLRKLSESINRFLQKYYVDLYTKLSKLSWGPFAPRAFGVFSMIAINFNIISNYHWDDHDEPNIVYLRPGQVVAFASRLLLH
ncbi:18239_t:CDS:2, partial [Racocetra persica]